MVEQHNWGDWIYCDDFSNHKYSRVCKICGTIDMTNKPCESENNGRNV